MRNKQPLLATAQVAERLGVTVTTVNRMAADGRLPVAQKMPGRTGAYLFDSAAVEALRSKTDAA